MKTTGRRMENVTLEMNAWAEEFAKKSLESSDRYSRWDMTMEDHIEIRDRELLKEVTWEYREESYVKEEKNPRKGVCVYMTVTNGNITLFEDLYKHMVAAEPFKHLDKVILQGLFRIRYDDALEILPKHILEIVENNIKEDLIRKQLVHEIRPGTIIYVTVLFTLESFGSLYYGILGDTDPVVSMSHKDLITSQNGSYILNVTHGDGVVPRKTELTNEVYSDRRDYYDETLRIFYFLKLIGGRQIGTTTWFIPNELPQVGTRSSIRNRISYLENSRSKYLKIETTADWNCYLGNLTNPEDFPTMLEEHQTTKTFLLCPNSRELAECVRDLDSNEVFIKLYEDDNCYSNIRSNLVQLTPGESLNNITFRDNVATASYEIYGGEFLHITPILKRQRYGVFDIPYHNISDMTCGQFLNTILFHTRAEHPESYFADNMIFTYKNVPHVVTTDILIPSIYRSLQTVSCDINDSEYVALVYPDKSGQERNPIVFAIIDISTDDIIFAKDIYSLYYEQNRVLPHDLIGYYHYVVKACKRHNELAPVTEHMVMIAGGKGLIWTDLGTIYFWNTSRFRFEQFDIGNMIEECGDLVHVGVGERQFTNSPKYAVLECSMGDSNREAIVKVHITRKSFQDSFEDIDNLKPQLYHLFSMNVGSDDSIIDYFMAGVTSTYSKISETYIFYAQGMKTPFKYILTPAVMKDIIRYGKTINIFGSNRQPRKNSSLFPVSVEEKLFAETATIEPYESNDNLRFIYDCPRSYALFTLITGDMLLNSKGEELKKLNRIKFDSKNHTIPIYGDSRFQLHEVTTIEYDIDPNKLVSIVKLSADTFSIAKSGVKSEDTVLKINPNDIENPIHYTSKDVCAIFDTLINYPTSCEKDEVNETVEPETPKENI